MIMTQPIVDVPNYEQSRVQLSGHWNPRTRDILHSTHQAMLLYLPTGTTAAHIMRLIMTNKSDQTRQ